jgi:hypothetical protein
VLLCLSMDSSLPLAAYQSTQCDRPMRVDTDCKDNYLCCLLLILQAHSCAAVSGLHAVLRIATVCWLPSCTCVMSLHAAVQTKRDPIYAWKALRLAVRESLPSVAATIEPLAQRPPQKQPQKRRGIDLEDLVHKMLPVSGSIWLGDVYRSTAAALQSKSTWPILHGMGSLIHVRQIGASEIQLESSSSTWQWPY